MWEIAEGNICAQVVYARKVLITIVQRRKTEKSCTCRLDIIIVIMRQQIDETLVTHLPNKRITRLSKTVVCMITL